MSKAELTAMTPEERTTALFGLPGKRVSATNRGGGYPVENAPAPGPREGAVDRVERDGTIWVDFGEKRALDGAAYVESFNWTELEYLE